MSIHLTFLGAARNVTGSRYLLATSQARVYIDCGLFQEWDLKGRNWAPFTPDPSDIDAVLLTHGHLDHCGLLPRLAQQGFTGAIHCSSATADIAELVMADSAYIQEEDAQYKAKRHRKEGRKGRFPELPLYTREDAESASKLLRSHPFREAFSPAPGIEATLFESGHILGAASILVKVEDSGKSVTILFSGDIGPWDMPIVNDPELPEHADYVVMESTYGNREHEDQSEVPARLAEVIHDTIERGGKLLIPSFAIERTQDLLYHLGNLEAAGKIPRLPVFLDSPLAIRVTEVFRRHPELFDEEARELLENGRHPCDLPNLQLCHTREDSMAINDWKGPAIVIAGSGMCTGGRIKHHLDQNLHRPESTVLFVGYQAEGTLGRNLESGAKQVRLFGKMHDVHARIERIHGFSAHAGHDDLLRWAGGFHEPPRRFFVTHGEEESAENLANDLQEGLHVPAVVPRYQQRVSLD